MHQSSILPTRTSQPIFTTELPRAVMAPSESMAPISSRTDSALVSTDCSGGVGIPSANFSTSLTPNPRTH
eukprot:CAMPEP_0118657742 /NCGR_PEP_ID=MMETSP0785-20121206/14187_1 /TAXON_ID=91992 /ORGANISM="Bolidomonas pacifica, Strain CCMP 1866" /LENGTH=69 /DNA_ID=CAMNT_0006550693 /DNA_START=29 /DNA_END=235 /DNA_ORIENTATION=-